MLYWSSMVTGWIVLLVSISKSASRPFSYSKARGSCVDRFTGLNLVIITSMIS